jgi:hypothetical protein
MKKEVAVVKDSQLGESRAELAEPIHFRRNGPGSGVRIGPVALMYLLEIYKDSS